MSQNPEIKVKTVLSHSSTHKNRKIKSRMFENFHTRLSIGKPKAWKRPSLPTAKEFATLGRRGGDFWNIGFLKEKRSFGSWIGWILFYGGSFWRKFWFWKLYFSDLNFFIFRKHFLKIVKKSKFNFLFKIDFWQVTSKQILIISRNLSTKFHSKNIFPNSKKLPAASTTLTPASATGRTRTRRRTGSMWSGTLTRRSVLCGFFWFFGGFWGGFWGGMDFLLVVFWIWK